MAIVFSCACGKQLSSKEEFAGRRICCPKCQEIVTIPGGKAKDEDEGSEVAKRSSAVKASPWFDSFLGQRATPWQPGDEARYQKQVVPPRDGPRCALRWTIALLFLIGLGVAGFFWLPDFIQRVQARVEAEQSARGDATAPRS